MLPKLFWGGRYEKHLGTPYILPPQQDREGDFDQTKGLDKKGLSTLLCPAFLCSTPSLAAWVKNEEEGFIDHVSFELESWEHCCRNRDGPENSNRFLFILLLVFFLYWRADRVWPCLEEKWRRLAQAFSSGSLSSYLNSGVRERQITED